MTIARSMMHHERRGRGAKMIHQETGEGYPEAFKSLEKKLT